jgi:hypothetical protein
MPISGKAGRIIAAVQDEGEDEPIFILRAKDLFSVMAIVEYLRVIEAYAPSDSEFQESIVNILERFKTWQKENIHRVRYPD